MPRIRTLKPEHRTHRKIGPLSHITYRLWVGMILEADDHGRLVCDAEQLRVTIFGYHPSVRRTIVEGSIQELATSGLLRLYAVEGVRYAWFPSWHDHQKIDRKQDSKLPPYTDSSNDRRTIVESSSSVRHGSDLDLDLDLEGRGSDLSCAVDTAPEVAILQWLNKKAGKDFRLKEANLGFIRARLADGIHDWQLKAIVSRKVRDWAGTEQAKYLRPKTLFNKTNCEQYLGDLPAVAENGQPD